MVKQLLQLYLKDLFKLGCHLGHHKKFYNSTMSNDLLGSRANIDIINIEKTLLILITLTKIIKYIVSFKGTFAFVNTLPMFNTLLYFFNKFSQQYSITGAWANGTLTNLMTSKKILLNKNNINFEQIPDIIFLINVQKNKNIIKELLCLAVPSIALADSNVNKRMITYGIPSNDDSFVIIYFFLLYISICFKYFKKIHYNNNKIVKIKRYFKNYGIKYNCESKIKIAKEG